MPALRVIHFEVDRRFKSFFQNCDMLAPNNNSDLQSVGSISVFMDPLRMAQNKPQSPSSSSKFFTNFLKTI